MHISKLSAVAASVVLAISLTACNPASNNDTASTGGKQETEPKVSGPDMTQQRNVPGEGEHRGRRGGGGIDKSADKQLSALIAEVEPKFTALTFTDPETGRRMDYNLFVPPEYDGSQHFPLVMFIADASTVGKGTATQLTQGYGGLVWASKESQKKHPSLVLVPAFSGPGAAVNDNSETDEEVGVAYRLLQSVIEQYSVDKSRIYATGQSMGGMISFHWNATYPDLFAASLFVGSQWDVSLLAPLTNDTFFYVVSAGDKKASAGMAELGSYLESEDIVIGRASFSAKLPQAEQDEMIEALIEEGHDKNFVQFDAGTVTPAIGRSGGGAEHMYSFDYAYKLTPIRDWLFNQTLSD